MLLREKDKKVLLEIFSNTTEPVEVWAYGSRVNGNAHDSSDLDLIVKSKKSLALPSKIYSDFVSKIKDSNIPVLVELRDWYLLPESFHKYILQNHEVLL